MVQRAKRSDVETTKRSAYPLYGLSRAIQVGKIVADMGGANSLVGKSLIARELSVDGDAAVLTQSIGATKSFGFISGHGAYRLTQTGSQFYRPAHPAEQRHALLAAIKTPTVFESLINRFDGSRVPTADALTNILERDYDVTESWRPRVASMFLSSLKEAQLIDEGGFLRYKASLHSVDVGKIPAMDTAVQMPPAQDTSQTHVNHATPPPRRDADNGNVQTTWIHQGVRVETPERLTMDLWKRLLDYVNVLKPGGEVRENN